MRRCRFCSEVMPNAVHERWCKSNPKLEENKRIHSSKISEGASERTKRAWESGKMAERKQSTSGKPHSEETKQLLREKALASTHRRLVRSIREYKKKDGTIVMLDSYWEEMLAKRLDEINVSWIRPGPIKWIDKLGTVRNYFPDFYLPEFDLFLDPKNPIAMKQQQEKVTWLRNNIKNLIFLETVSEIIEFAPVA